MARRLLSVMHFSNARVRYGAEEHMVAILRGLSGDYFRFDLVCPPRLLKQVGRDLPEDVHVIPFCPRKPAQIFGALRLAEIMRRRGVDVLHSHMSFSGRLASPVAWAC